MLVFDIKRSNGRKGKWMRKFPRAAIERAGGGNKAEHVCEWYANNWNDDNYPYVSFRGIDRFLEKYVGKSVDIAYSDFLKRVTSKARGLETSIHDTFMSFFDDPDGAYAKRRGCYYIDSQNRVQRKKKERESKSERVRKYTEYMNRVNYNKKILTKNVLLDTALECNELLHRIYVGDLYVYDSEKPVPVYIVRCKDLKYYINSIVVRVQGFGYGVRVKGFPCTKDNLDNLRIDYKDKVVPWLSDQDCYRFIALKNQFV